MMIPSPHLAFGMLHFWSFSCISQLFARQLYKFCNFTQKITFWKKGLYNERRLPDSKLV